MDSWLTMEEVEEEVLTVLLFFLTPLLLLLLLLLHPEGVRLPAISCQLHFCLLER